MKPPRHPKGHLDRLLDLEEKLETVFLQAIEEAVLAGYSEIEALEAFSSLVDNRQIALAENFITEAMIGETLQRSRMN